MKRIAVIGPADMIDKVLVCSKEFVDLEFQAFSYENERLAPKIVRAVQDSVDGILFTGPIPYHISFESLQIEKPWNFVPYTTTGLLKVLIDFIKKYPKFLSKPVSFSIDTLKEDDVIETIEETGLKVKKIYIKEYDPEQEPVPSFLKFHLKLIKEKRIDMVFSCVKSTWEEINRRNFSAFLIRPLKSTIRIAINRLSLAIETENKKREVVVGLFLFNNKDPLVQKKEMIKVHALLLDDIYKWGGILVNHEPNELFLITSYSHIYKESNAFSNTPFSNIYNSISPDDISMIFGSGRDVMEAERNAREAEKLLREERRESPCVIYDGMKIKWLKPITKSRVTKVIDRMLIDWSKKVGVSASKLASLFEVFSRKSRFTSDEVSRILNISPRTSRRILQKLTENGFLKIAGKDFASSRGRPKYIYAFTDNAEKLRKHT